jgi:hypothetical protein
VIKLSHTLEEVIDQVVIQQDVKHCLTLIFVQRRDNVTTDKCDTLGTNKLIKAGDYKVGAGRHGILLEVFKIGEDLNFTLIEYEELTKLFC